MTPLVERQGASNRLHMPLDSGTIRIFDQKDLISEHKTVTVEGAMVVQPSHYAELPRRSGTAAVKQPLQSVAELALGTGVGLHSISC